MRRTFFWIGAATLVFTVLAYGQDSPSLGDVARQTRAQKQKDASKNGANAAQTSDAAAKSGTAHRVITNEELPAHAAAPAPISSRASNAATTVASKPEDHQALGETWKSQILAQKQAIADLQNQISSLSSSIRYAGAECAYNCTEWNQRQQEKQQQVESMKSQLEEQQKRLEDMQESARRQGFGSSVYDP